MAAMDPPRENFDVDHIDEFHILSNIFRGRPIGPAGPDIVPDPIAYLFADDFTGVLLRFRYRAEADRLGAFARSDWLNLGRICEREIPIAGHP
jgi:hypothetical protein